MGRREQHPPQDTYPPGVVEIIQAIRDYSTPSPISPRWKAESYTLTAGESRMIAHTNLARRRALVFTDGANASGVGISPATIQAGLEQSAGLVVLAPGAPAVEMLHSGEIHAYASSAGNTVYIIEEYAN